LTKKTVWRSAFCYFDTQNTVPYCQHSYRLLFRRFCPLGASYERYLPYHTFNLIFFKSKFFFTQRTVKILQI